MVIYLTFQFVYMLSSRVYVLTCLISAFPPTFVPVFVQEFIMELIGLFIGKNRNFLQELLAGFSGCPLKGLRTCFIVGITWELSGVFLQEPSKLKASCRNYGRFSDAKHFVHFFFVLSYKLEQ